MDLNSEELAAEVRLVREKGKGMTRLDQLRLPLLTEAARIVLGPAAADQKASVVIEKLLRLAVARLGDGDHGKGAAAALGLAPGTRGLGARERQEAAAKEMGIFNYNTYRTSYQNEQMADVATQVEVLVAEAQTRASPFPNYPSQVRITVRLGINPQTEYHKRDIELTGDLDRWCLSVMRARYGQPMPPTDVVVEVEPEPISDMYRELGETPASIRREFETSVSQVYGMVFEDAIVEIARLGLQYLPHYYHDGSGVKLLLEAVLNNPWHGGTPGSDPTHRPLTYRLYASYQGSMSVPLKIPHSYFDELAERNGEQVSYEFLSRRLGWVADLRDELNTTVVLPAIIGIWMQWSAGLRRQGRDQRHNVDAVLNPAAWKLTVDF